MYIKYMRVFTHNHVNENYIVRRPQYIGVPDNRYYDQQIQDETKKTDESQRDRRESIDTG